jgi:hypothetical protein
VASFMPQQLYHHRNSPWYPLDRRMGGPQSQSGHSGEEKNSQPPLGLKPQIIQAIAQLYTTEPSQLLFIFTQNFIFLVSCFIRYWCQTTHFHLVLTSKNAWNYTSTSQHIFRVWCLVRHRDNFIFTFTCIKL